MNNARLCYLLAWLTLLGAACTHSTPLASLPRDRVALAADLAREPQKAERWRDVGWADYLAGDSARASEEFDRALSLDPRDARALLGRALLYHESGRTAAARNSWVDILERADLRDPWSPTITATAAAKLLNLAGEVPHERELQARLARLDLARHSWEVRARLLALQAWLARRFGDENEGTRLDRLRGCPSEWWIAGPLGRWPHLDLGRAFPVEQDISGTPQRPAPTRSCTFSVETPFGRPGVAYATTWVETKRAQQVVLTIAASQPWRLLVDGRTAWQEEDPRRFPPHARVLDVPLAAGWHRVAIKLSAGSPHSDLTVTLQGQTALTFAAPTADQQVHAGKAAKASEHLSVMPGTYTQNFAPLADFLAAQAAARAGAPDAADAALNRLLQSAPRFVPSILVAAQLATEDDSRPGHIARDRVRQLFEQALTLDASAMRARYNLALMDLDDDHADKALDRLEQVNDAKQPALCLPESSPSDAWRLLLLRYQVLKTKGWRHEANRVLAQARAANPEACPALDAEVTQAREHFDFTLAERAARELERCQPQSDALADLLRDTGRAAEAAAEYRRLLSLDATRESWRGALAETLLENHQPSQAIEILLALVRDYPRVASYRQRLANAYISQGATAQAREALRAGLVEMPDSEELLRASSAFGEPNPIDPYRIDGQRVIADFMAQKNNYPTPAVIVLDRTVMLILPTGARLTLTHNIIRVQNKDGIDKFGEVTIPEGADVLLLRTVKADGTTREPEEFAEKRSISAPDLEPGDFVEFETVEHTPALTLFPGGFLGERFYFASFDAPLDRTEYVLVTPEGMPVVIDRRGAAPPMVEEKRQVHGSRVMLRTWSDRQRPQLVSEPRSTPFPSYVSSVRAASAVSYEAWRETLRDQQFGVLRSNAELRSLALRLTAGKPLAERVRAIDEWVRHHIEPEDGWSEGATSILARGAGNRVILERALLAAVGIPAQIWLARSQDSAVLEGALPDLESYHEPVLALDGIAGIRVINPRYRHMPTGLLAPVFRGQPALVVEATPQATFARTPANEDERRVVLDARIEPSGEAEVTVEEKLRGWPAVEWREGLDQISPDRLRPEFEQRTLGFFFPGVALHELSFSGRDNDAEPLTVRYSFRAPQFARREGNRLLITAPFAVFLGKNYVGVSQRQTPLLTMYAPPTHISARFHLPTGAQAIASPPVTADSFGHFSQSVEARPGSVLLETNFAMPIMQIDKARYSEFARFADLVDSAEGHAAEVVLP